MLLYIQSTISINRCAVVKKGGKVLSYAAIVVVGNGKGLAAIGKGKDKEVGRATRLMCYCTNSCSLLLALLLAGLAAFGKGKDKERWGKI